MAVRLFSRVAIILFFPVWVFAADLTQAVPAVETLPSDAVVISIPTTGPQTMSLPTPPVSKVLTLNELNRKRFQRLQEISRDLKGQRESMADFDAYLKWMGGAVAGYGKYVEAGSFAAGFARYLPVPYAGQAGQLTKFISHFALSISSTSAAVTSYLNSSGYFITGVEALGTNPEWKESDLAMLTFYADQQLSRDIYELQGRLDTISDLSGSALSFLLGLQQYLGSTDEYWQKTKSLIARKDADKAEKGALASSIDSLRSRAEKFNNKLKQYDTTVNGTMPRIASLVAYEELRQDIEAMTATAAVSP